MSTRNRPASTSAGSAASSLRRPPPALRGAPGSRGSGAKAHVSLVFAHGDAAPVPSSSASIRSVSRYIASPSEEALSRQLDRDTAGERMSLRSRRSSGATLASRVDFSPHPLSPPFQEEEEAEVLADHEAGPSTPQRNSPLSATLPDTRLPRSVNPKASDVWRRWNSPAPSFPRKEESKAASKAASVRSAKDDAMSERRVGRGDRDDHFTKPALANSSAMDQLAPTASQTEEPRTPEGGETPREQAASQLSGRNLEVNIQAPTPTRGWLASIWGGSTPATPKPEHRGEPSEVVAGAGGAGEGLTKVDSRVSATSSVVTNGTAGSKRVEMTIGPSWGPDSTPSASIAKDAAIPGDSAVEQAVDSSFSDDERVPETKPAPGTKPAPETQPAPETKPAPADDDATTPVGPQQPGWGPYLWSWVVPPPMPPLHPQEPLPEPEEPAAPPPAEVPDAANAVRPTDMTADQQPVCEPTTCINHDPPTEPEAIIAPCDSPPTQAVLATSNSSTSGWLSYLAFRASQKRVTGSTITPEDARRSGETQREEVMDLENDPNFPESETTPRPPRTDTTAKGTKDNAPPEAKPRTSTDSKSVRVSSEAKRPSSVLEAKPAAKGSDRPASIADVKQTAKDTKVANGSASIVSSASNKRLSHRRSQNLAIASRRLSEASSVHSSSSIPPSPRVAQSRQNNPASDLAPPPQSSSKQPNFVIPTFETTFDRPPRSLLPQTTSSGVGAATGLAVRALGALGSYVYSGNSKPEPQETRGKKEGRDIGANLPRRVGLVSGSPDDGWRHVTRVVVVGVHGWFPTKMLTSWVAVHSPANHSVIGEPTGTSAKFATMMGDAVKKFFQDNAVDEEDIRLTMIPLEGEGTIESRVDRLYKQYLSNPAWINDLRRADAILFAAHSQGCIVTTHLISRMIAQGHIRTPLNREAVARCEWAFGPIGIVPDEKSKRGRQLAANLPGAEGGRQKVAMLAMCGVHLGPLYSISTSSVIGPYLQWFENAAARELFEFQDSSSRVSQAYQKALAMILENEVRVLLLSSLNDQVVPIYGASFASATHPLLLRALYVDGASYSASDFMTNLICFAFMLRNAGIDDQRLVEHLSEATAGSLTGVGHSTPYEELGCYSLAVQYLFHSGPAPTPLPALQVEPFAARDGRNDFELPWIMRAIVDSPEVKDLFPDELQELKDSIIAWRPQTKALKEMKKRLEPMAGRRHLSSLAVSAVAVDDRERDKDKDKDKDKEREVRRENPPQQPSIGPAEKKKPRVTPSRL